MVFLETSVFTKRVTNLFSDEDYNHLQNYLKDHPDAGDIIPGTGGIRKYRWGINERGKRGGARFIYYWQTSQDQILMLFVFAKNEASDLTSDQKKQLRAIVEEEYP